MQETIDYKTRVFFNTQLERYGQSIRITRGLISASLRALLLIPGLPVALIPFVPKIVSYFLHNDIIWRFER